MVKKTLAGDLLRKIGGELVPLGDIIGPEQLIEADPDVIFLIVSENAYDQAEQIKERLMSQPALRNLHAFQTGRVHIVPLYYVYSSATRTYDGILLFTRALYPDLYEEGI